MEPTAIAALLPPSRFHSFAEAADAALDSLSRSLPGTILFGRFDASDGACRVSDVGGAPISGIERGLPLPLGASASHDGTDPGAAPVVNGDDSIDDEWLRVHSIESSLAVPLELSDGSVVGLMCALSGESGAYVDEHAALLRVAARVLSYEWESVLIRADLRDLRERLRDDDGTDLATGLPSRRDYVNLLERDWKLARRGTLHGMVVTCHVEVDGLDGEASRALANVAFKDVAAALAGTARSTDRVGRISWQGFAVTLLGADGVGARAFVGRFRRAVERVVAARPVRVELHFGYQALEEAESAVAALQGAEEDARPEDAGSGTARLARS